MKDYPPHELDIVYRMTHSQVWEIADKSGILAQMKLSIHSMGAADDPRKAEDMLFRGDIDFVSGNHITPYRWLASGKPIVCIASPQNEFDDAMAVREPVASLADFKVRGLRVADSNLLNNGAYTSHTRGNHILEVLRAGYEPGEAEWLEIGQTGDPGFQASLFDAVKSGRADAAFVTRNRAEVERAGLHVLELPSLPMINGTTITTSYETLHKKEGLAERLIQAMILTVHYARMHPEEAQRLLDTKMDKPYTQNGGRASMVARFPIKPYPTAEGIANAYELSCMQYEEAKATSPIALWDMHYLRDLDLSGFIDELIQEESADARRGEA